MHGELCSFKNLHNEPISPLTSILLRILFFRALKVGICAQKARDIDFTKGFFWSKTARMGGHMSLMNPLDLSI
jgi:hypothetical protein